MRMGLDTIIRGFVLLLILGYPSGAGTVCAEEASAVATSFESFAPGPLRKQSHDGLTVQAAPGHAEIDSRHRRTGKSCLRLLGGADRTLELTADLRQGATRLAFWAERWTQRAPFSFVIETRRGRKWAQVHDASREVRVGGFRVQVQVAVRNVKRFRLRSTTPPNGGVLIDDLRIDRNPIEAAPLPTRADLPKLQPKINAAIDKGVAHLLANQSRDGSWGFMAERFRTGQTALCAYTLLKCGLPATHAAVRRALLHMRHAPPHEVYTVACHLLALEATGDPRNRPRMQELLDALLSWQSRGHWSYPWAFDDNKWRDTIDHSDMSNTQYAALGLRAARRAGLRVPDGAWKTMLARTLKHQEKPYQVKATKEGASTSSGTEIAGFFYGGLNKHGVTGSMTTAGISIVKICVEALGKRLRRRAAAEAKRAIERGVGWLAHNFVVDRNPGRTGWIYYYLYGLERVGALLDMKTFGAHDWYVEGAQHLVEKQAADGHWSERAALPDTCFALLFLRRATGPTTGTEPARRAPCRCDGKSEVLLQGRGNSRLTVWVRGFSDEARARKGDLIVTRVEYLVDGRVIATTMPKGKPAPWTKMQSFPAQHEFDSNGEHSVAARVFIQGRAEPLVGSGFKVQVTDAFEPWMAPAANRTATNLLRRSLVTATASTQASSPAHAVDGLESTGWICAVDDADPTLTLVLGKPVSASTIVIGPLASNAQERAAFDRVRVLELQIDKEPPQRVRLSDPMRPATLELASQKPIRRLRIRIVERDASTAHPGRAGIAEIALER